MEDPTGAHRLNDRLHLVLLQQVDLVGDHRSGQLRRLLPAGASGRAMDGMAPPGQQVTEVAPGKAVDAGDEDGLTASRPATPPPASVARRLPTPAARPCRFAPREDPGRSVRNGRR